MFMPILLYDDYVPLAINIPLLYKEAVAFCNSRPISVSLSLVLSSPPETFVIFSLEYFHFHLGKHLNTCFLTDVRDLFSDHEMLTISHLQNYIKKKSTTYSVSTIWSPEQDLLA